MSRRLRATVTALAVVALTALAACSSSGGSGGSSGGSTTPAGSTQSSSASSSNSATSSAGGSSTGSSTGSSSSQSTQSASPTTGSWQTVEAGYLTIALPDFPYKGYLNGDNPESPTDGYYVAMVDRVAKDMGLKVKYKKVDFTSFISGMVTGWDIAVDTLSVTPERQEKFDMSVPVVHFYKALFTKKGAKVATQDDIRNMVLGSGSTSVNFKFITDQIKPNKQPHGFSSDVQKYDAVNVGSIDGAIGDLYVSMAKTASFPGTEVACKWTDPQPASWAMPKNSPISAEVNRIITEMTNDGTMAALEKQWIIPLAGGGDPNAVPACPTFP